MVTHEALTKLLAGTGTPSAPKVFLRAPYNLLAACGLTSAPWCLSFLLHAGLMEEGLALLMVSTQHCEDSGTQGDLSAYGSL